MAIYYWLAYRHVVTALPANELLLQTFDKWCKEYNIKGVAHNQYITIIAIMASTGRNAKLGFAVTGPVRFKHKNDSVLFALTFL